MHVFVFFLCDGFFMIVCVIVMVVGSSSATILIQCMASMVELWFREWASVTLVHF